MNAPFFPSKFSDDIYACTIQYNTFTLYCACIIHLVCVFVDNVRTVQYSTVLV